MPWGCGGVETTTAGKAEKWQSEGQVGVCVVRLHEPSLFLLSLPALLAILALKAAGIMFLAGADGGATDAETFEGELDDAERWGIGAGPVIPHKCTSIFHPDVVLRAHIPGFGQHRVVLRLTPSERTACDSGFSPNTFVGCAESRLYPHPHPANYSAKPPTACLEQEILYSTKLADSLTEEPAPERSIADAARTQAEDGVQAPQCLRVSWAHRGKARSIVISTKQCAASRSNIVAVCGEYDYSSFQIPGENVDGSIIRSDAPPTKPRTSGAAGEDISYLTIGR
ncbi:hypothetical protein JB92DRAFT_2830365 [Gautieria morchelliformis]|nr:hypothetical protein JB92DRAFT_2830365 [Gautieria morchelliformis]